MSILGKSAVQAIILFAVIGVATLSLPSLALVTYVTSITGLAMVMRPKIDVADSSALHTYKKG